MRITHSIHQLLKQKIQPIKWMHIDVFINKQLHIQINMLNLD